MIIKTMLLTVIFSVFSAMPVLVEYTQAAKTSEVKTDSTRKADKDIQIIQRKLLNAGYKPGNINGVFGLKTSQAIIKYQKKHGLPQSGFPDDKFIEHLDKNPASKPK